MTNNCELNELLSTQTPPSAETPRSKGSQAAQQELQERYEEQQRRLCCPSCGEEPFIDYA